VGDLCQKPPAFGTSLAQAVLQVHRHEQLRDLEIKRASVASNQAHPQQRIGIVRRKRLQSKRISDDPNEESIFDPAHPFRIGCDLFARSRWIELKQQMRSVDEEHSLLVEKLYAREQLDFGDLSGYEWLSREDLEGDFKLAPIIVRTNRERYTLTHFRSIQFAKTTGQVVFRWRAKHSHWEQMPQVEKDIESAMEDPAFYEYFVVGASGHITAKVNKEKR
jgi:hypothetical protein